jgi:ATP-dependent RNA helicase SUPV3L1/SUV3
MGADAMALDVRFGEDGSITVEDEPLGRLDGFDLRIDHLARLEDRKRLTAAVERQLPNEMARRAQMLFEAPDREIILATRAGLPITICWRNAPVATLVRGRALLSPALALHPALLKLPAELHARLNMRLVHWLDHLLETRLAPLKSLLALSSDPLIPAAVRAVAASLASATGVFARTPIESSLDALTPQERRRLRQAGVVIGALDIFHHGLLKPEATRIRLALLAIHRGKPMPPLPMPGLTLLDHPSPDLSASARDAGYRGFGEQMLRIDLVERIARALHDQRGRKLVFAPDTQIATQMGVGDATLAKILRGLGFFPSGPANPELWRWRGRQRSRTAVTPASSSFEALRQWTTRGAS